MHKEAITIRAAAIIKDHNSISTHTHFGGRGQTKKLIIVSVVCANFLGSSTLLDRNFIVIVIEPKHSSLT